MLDPPHQHSSTLCFLPFKRPLPMRSHLLESNWAPTLCSSRCCSPVPLTAALGTSLTSWLTGTSVAAAALCRRLRPGDAQGMPRGRRWPHSSSALHQDLPLLGPLAGSLFSPGHRTQKVPVSPLLSADAPDGPHQRDGSPHPARVRFVCSAIRTATCWPPPPAPPAWPATRASSATACGGRPCVRSSALTGPLRSVPCPHLRRPRMCEAFHGRPALRVRRYALVTSLTPAPATAQATRPLKQLRAVARSAVTFGL